MSSCSLNCAVTPCQERGERGERSEGRVWDMGQSCVIPVEELEEISHHLDDCRVHEGQNVLDILHSILNIFVT